MSSTVPRTHDDLSEDQQKVLGSMLLRYPDLARKYDGLSEDKQKVMGSMMLTLAENNRVQSLKAEIKRLQDENESLNAEKEKLKTQNEALLVENKELREGRAREV